MKDSYFALTLTFICLIVSYFSNKPIDIYTWLWASFFFGGVCLICSAIERK